nr:sigma 54-interacting transcriptional regulator [Dissulfurirhabdus thermomarina]
MTRALVAAADLKAALREVMEILAARMGMSRGTVTIVNPRTGALEIEVAHGLSAEARRRGRYRIGEGITGQVVATGKPLVVPRISEEPRFLNRTRSRGDLHRKDISFLCVPIQAGRETIGALSVDRLFDGTVSFEEDLRLLTIISGLVAQTVSRLQAINAEREQLLSENLTLRRALEEKYGLDNLVGKSSRMVEVFEMIHRVAGSTATVLLRGESGTGKSMAARAIHFNSPRKDRPFVTVSCSALPETLIESELFGHERGAFTGATARKPGRFEQAEGGTIFLDEIGELPHNVQVKLLHVIQEREFQRLGGARPIRCDVRIVAATNKNLEEAVAAGQFREDLYYRLNVFPIYLPPLRERRTDILLLAEHFLAQFARENEKAIHRISSPAIDLLVQYHWPGNVRELQNCMERAVLVCDEDVIRARHLPPTLQTAASAPGSGRRAPSLADAVAAFEKELIEEALKESRGNQTRAAALLDTSLRIINYKIHKYGIDPSRFKNPA